MFKKIIYVLLATALITSCSKVDENPFVNGADFFTGKSVVGAYSKTGEIIVYNNIDHQFATSQEDFNYRIQTDSQEQYFDFRISADPKSLKINDDVDAIITSKGVGVASKNISMTLVKVDNGMYWFMDATSELGIVAKFVI